MANRENEGMNRLKKLVAVRHHEHGKLYLFEAPLVADVLEGDTVICKTRKGDMTYGIAEAVAIVPECNTEYRMILKLADAIEPLSQVVGKYMKIDF